MSPLSQESSRSNKDGNNRGQSLWLALVGKHIRKKNGNAHKDKHQALWIKAREMMTEWVQVQD